MMAEGGARLCGFRRCRQAAVPGLYVEGLVDLGGSLQDVRIEACEDHGQRFASQVILPEQRAGR